ncbi:MAG: hypothetical protein KIS68_06285 [Bauldia sp.]|nr:hypothetical protein [Bauldia sp.]
MRSLLDARRAAAAAAMVAGMALPAAAQAPLAAPAPDLQCRAMEPYVAEANQTMPQAADDVTENVEIRLDCAAGTITYIKRLLVAPADLPANWERLRQAQHTATYCSPDGATARYGLVAMDALHAPDGAIVTLLTTTPADCARVEGGQALLTLAELDAYLEERAQAIRPTLPVRIDDVTTMVSIFHGAAALIYFYQLGFVVPEAQRAAFAETATDLRNQLCADSGVRLVLFSGGTVTYRYSDSAGAPVFSVAIAAADCVTAP